MVDEELRTSLEEVDERHRARLGLELILLVDTNPRQILNHSSHFVTSSRQCLLGLKHFGPGIKPFFSCCDLVISHWLLPSFPHWHMSGCGHESRRPRTTRPKSRGPLVDARVPPAICVERFVPPSAPTYFEAQAGESGHQVE